jgi:pantetheine-phosphate adenylyltransferase
MPSFPYVTGKERGNSFFMKAVYSGTFDPITNGHLDIISRASRMFDEVVVLIMRNPRKHCMFTEEERMDMIERSLRAAHLDNVSVAAGQGLTVDMASHLGASAIIRGIRAVSDYEYELMQATANMKLNPQVETMLMIARPEYSFLSSSAVKEIAINGGSIKGMVPDVIMDEVSEKMAHATV